MRIVFAGTPPFAATVLGALLTQGWTVVCALTQPDRRAGRGRKLTASAVKRMAEDAGIAVYQPARLGSPETIDHLSQLCSDVMVVAAYGLLLPESVLSLPRHGCLNVHASLLPRWRGAAPVQRAILAGDTQTGITIMQMDAGLDTGDILASVSCEIRADDTTGSLLERLANLGAESLIATLDKLRGATLSPRPQPPKGATYASRVSKPEAMLDWSLPAPKLERMVRAFNPWPVAQTTYANAPLKIWEAKALARQSGAAPGSVVAVTTDGIDVATGDGQLRVATLQIPGGRAMAVRDFLNARTLRVGEHLGD
jgi:methionyl-tRNA formyltransferase